MRTYVRTARIERSGAVDKESLKVLLGQGLSVEKIADEYAFALDQMN